MRARFGVLWYLPKRSDRVVLGTYRDAGSTSGR